MAQHLQRYSSIYAASSYTTFGPRRFFDASRYIPPEMYGDRGYSFEIDWWAVGVIFWELSECKNSPFGNSKSDIRSNLVDWSCSYPHVGKFISQERWTEPDCGLAFQLALLNPLPSKRLGSPQGGSVLDHPLFSEGVLERVKSGMEAPPFKPSADWC